MSPRSSAAPSPRTARTKDPVGAALTRVRRELDQRGLLLMADRRLPALTTVVAGEPVKGSWWSHSSAKTIFAVAKALHEADDVVVLPLVDGKVTFVHRRLWPALLGAAAGQARSASADLSDTARTLRSLVSRRGDLRLDRPSVAKLADGAVLGSAAKELGARLLVVTDQVHTDSGAHTTRLRSWTRWKDGVQDPPERLVPTEGRAALEQAATALARESGHVPRLPWQATGV